MGETDRVIFDDPSRKPGALVTEADRSCIQSFITRSDRAILC